MGASEFLRTGAALRYAFSLNALRKVRSGRARVTSDFSLAQDEAPLRLRRSRDRVGAAMW